MPKPKKTGPKNAITPKFLKMVERLAAKGLLQKQIATILNINACTISSWKHGEGELEKLFREALERGRAKSIERRMGKIDKAGEKSWQAHAWALERMFPDQFGRTQNLRHSDPNGNPLEPSTVIAPTVVFVQPEKKPIEPVIDITPKPQLGNGHGLPNGNGKH